MIATDLSHIERQLALTPLLRQAVDFLRRSDLVDLPDGNIAIDGDRVYAIVQRYETVAIAMPKFECHRKYIDLQYVASGEEIIGWSPADTIAATESYDPDRDICFGSVTPGSWTPIRLVAGQCAVLWPEDGHAPRIAVLRPSPVMKIVVKVAL
jgi:biofilm protein TabA